MRLGGQHGALVSSLVAAALAASSVSWSTANSVATGDQDGPAVAGNRSGRVAVVWEDDRDATDPADDNHSDVILRVFQDGAPVFEKKLSAGGTSGTNWKHITPDVGLDDRGDAVVVWAEDPDGNGVFNIAYRVVSPTGGILASATANANAAGDQIVPKVAVDPDGTPGNATAVAFTVVWEDVQGSAHTVPGRRIHRGHHAGVRNRGEPDHRDAPPPRRCRGRVGRRHRGLG
ncbi:MAG: hypothetical protein QOH97_5695, partial [Actinoplanes sp.]|nr:hypothetical protein [Actinoplanes sp.]